MNNPFDITKAVDFTDKQIVDYWVDVSNKGGFQEMLKPTSLVPMLVLGSKGSGKTHLMRFFSYELQKIKHSDLKQGIAKDKFVGVYIRCSGLNSERFSGRGQTLEVWNAIYAYYWELWVAQIVLNIVLDLMDRGVIEIPNETSLVNKILDLLNKVPDQNITSIKDLMLMFSSLQKTVDYEVENCIFNRDGNLHVDILLSPSKITYGLPNILTQYIPFLKDMVFLYLIDELENISEEQQKLIQTLLREKPVSCTFRIGARLYGVKTYRTLGGGEENREGSEFDKVVLDDFLRHNVNYEDFIRRICQHRLRINGIYIPHEKKFDDYIKSFDLNTFLEKIESKKIFENKPYLAKLKDKLNKRESECVIEKIISNLSFDDLLIERTNVFLFYRAWNKSKKLLEASEEIRKEALEFKRNSSNKASNHWKVLDKYKGDIVDVLSREMRENVPYYGFSEFVKMSCGTPRNLLNILKHAYKWTFFNEAKMPFVDVGIDWTAQTKGVKDTIDWFFEDNRIPVINGYGKPVDCIDRIGRYLRELRYSDAPPECSINLFGLNFDDLSINARSIFHYLEDYSYIIEVESRRDKNSNDKIRTYHINSTIAPNWELPLSKRGVIILSSNEAECIFNLQLGEEFDKLLFKKRQKYNAPFVNNSSQLSIF